MLLVSQRQPIGRLIDRIKSLTYPGGEAQLGVAVPEAGAETILALVDSLSRDLSERTERDDPASAERGFAAVAASLKTVSRSRVSSRFPSRKSRAW